ncbi:alcohol dehydrogenase catalytic domain-containing protein [Catenuloplanes atrovinosus]|uniref:S-(Hydroxymethyl)glutathione dehydrogenase/alcohol dehydrogenase n=1 Tax=Catenuloplanes atrovinosus TaxID=137266 RepID=A0AAE4C7R1_9ACTN|nr:zinc-binding dehydrogenase [Catenuloplanes atrovinosus]MDR7273807.1 S-(hydroxymethyl)glutathione dehydrogenase/alcohol dehydrogenase [Catenuloplanes atrovinosus]
MTTARGLIARGSSLTVEDFLLDPPGEGEIEVEIGAAGVCHSDLSMVNGTLAPSFPLVLGHEAAGTVIAAGPGVTRVAPGDRVVLNWSPPCRDCWFCARGEPWLCETSGAPSAPRGTLPDGTPLHVTLGLGALATRVVIPARAAVAVPAELSFADAALLGCAVLTGFGAVRNTARVAPGESVVVFGLGGVGLSVVGAARAAGAGPIVAVDVSPAKEALAIAAGATDFLVADDALSRAIRGLTGGRGADVTFECVGRAATIRSAYRSARRGGRVTVVGMGARSDIVELSALELFHSGRTLRGCVYGAADFDVEIPRLAAAVLDGTLDLRPLVTHHATLDESPAAFARMSRGEGARTVVLLSTKRS